MRTQRASNRKAEKNWTQSKIKCGRLNRAYILLIGREATANAKDIKLWGLTPAKAQRTPSDGQDPCHPERGCEDLRFLPEFTLSLAEGVEMTMGFFFATFAPLREMISGIGVGRASIPSPSGATTAPLP